MLLNNNIEQLEFIEIMQEIGLTESSDNYTHCDPVIKQRFHIQHHIGTSLNNNIPQRLDSLILLFKGLIICERDFMWRGGSVASNINIMQMIRRKSRSHLDLRNLDKLIKWTFINKGENRYTPFGAVKLSAVSSLAELLSIEEMDRKNALAQRDFERRQMDASKEKKRLQKELNDKVLQDRKAKNENRYRIFLKEIEIFQAKCEHQKLDALLTNELSFPINLLPEIEWLTIIRNKELGVLDINKLIKLIPKNTSQEIKQIKRFLQILKTPKVVTTPKCLKC
jgi:hypothetical protein